MPRLSITLTESQNTALERISKETGATKQSMIGLAVSSWIRENDVHDDFEPTPTYCEVCGKPAYWASFADDDTEHYFCDEHGMSDLEGRN